jgi:hypothetical protein
MKPEHTVLRTRAYRDPREPNYQPPDPWQQMFEEQQQRALKPEHPWKNMHYLVLALIACAAVIGVVGIVLW